MHIMNSSRFHPLFSFLILLCLLKKPFFPINPLFIAMPCFKCAVLSLTAIAWVWTDGFLSAAAAIATFQCVPLNKQHSLPQQPFLAKVPSRVGHLSPSRMGYERFQCPILWRSCAGNYSCSEFMGAKAMTSPEGFLRSSQYAWPPDCYGRNQDLAKIQPIKLRQES